MTDEADVLDGRDASILRTIDALAALDDDAPHAIDADAHATAVRLYRDFVMGRVEPRPKLFSHGGDALVLVWREGDRVLYATCCDGQVVLSVHVGGERTYTERVPIEEAGPGLSVLLQRLVDGRVRGT